MIPERSLPPGAGKGADHQPLAGLAAMLFAHHPPEEYYRCLRLRFRGRELLLCARCCGLYPALALLLAAQFVFGPAPGWHDWPWLFLPTVPFLIDWYGYRVAGRRGSNFFRVLSGAILAVSLSRALYLHIVEPLNQKFSWWCIFMAAFVLSVELIKWMRIGRGEN